MKIIESATLKRLISQAREERSHETTYIHHIPHSIELKDCWKPSGRWDDECLVWAVVVAWEPLDGDDQPPTLVAKLAHQSNRCVMQEYGIDWDMPVVNGRGDVDVNEISVEVGDLDYVVKHFEEVAQSYLEDNFNNRANNEEGESNG